MAIPVGTATTHSAVVNREDLSDIIYRISPTDTPFMSAIGRGKATNRNHEWVTDELDKPGSNAYIEGDTTDAKAISPGVRVSNRVQESRKSARISTIQEKSTSAGNLLTMSKQMAKKMAELKLDMEYALINNKTAVEGSSSTAAQLRGLEGWLKTNANKATDGKDPDPIANTAAVDGTQREFTEDLLKDTLQKIWQEGGNPNLILASGKQKQKFSTFDGRANTTVTDAASAKTLVNAVDIYVSDFGRLKVVPSRVQRARTVFVLETGKFAVDYLMDFKTKDLAYQGGSEAKEISVAYTLKCGNEKSSGVIRDLTE